MDWTPGGMSGDIEDRRNSSGGFGGMGGAAASMRPPGREPAVPPTKTAMCN